MHLRTLRTRRGWTQKDLWKKSKIPQNSISRLERDKNARPSIATVVALAKAFDVDPMSIQFGPPRTKTRERTNVEVAVPA
jgi:transcriptional regulator with XRE-family HTH domain